MAILIVPTARCVEVIRHCFSEDFNHLDEKHHQQTENNVITIDSIPFYHVCSPLLLVYVLSH